MWKAFLQPLKAIFPIMATLITAGFINPARSQQNIIINKDNTRPEITRQYKDQSAITSFTINRYNGYSEVNWTSLADASVKGFTIEYSTNGTDYQVAGQATAGNGTYAIKHYTNETGLIYYRVRNDRNDGRVTYSAVKELAGAEYQPVRLQSTMIRGNVVNATADRSVQRINVFSGNGDQVYARDVSGQKDYISTTLPALSKGIYYMTFYGDGWKNTQKFIVL